MSPSKIPTTPRLVVVVVVLVATFFASAPAFAALGGAAGVQIPYAGKLELNGVLASGTFDFQFQVMVDAATGTACDTKVVSAVTVTNGEFALTIPAVTEACVKGKDVHVTVGVRNAGGGAFTILGKQRVAPVLSAMTSGTGDFNTGATLTAASVTAQSIAATSSMTTPSLSTPAIETGGGGIITFHPAATLARNFTVQDTDVHRLNFRSSDAVVKDVVSFDGTLGAATSIRALAAVQANTTPDLAETIPAAANVEAADVVCADPAHAERVVRCARDARGVLGVISDGTSSFMINSRAHSVDAPLTGQPLVLAGRVPVKVSRENGAVHIGDELTLSSVPGVAMRADGPGAVVGIALADFDAAKVGTVLCFVKVSEGTNVAALARDNAALEKRVSELEARLSALAPATKEAAR